MWVELSSLINVKTDYFDVVVCILYPKNETSFLLLYIDCLKWKWENRTAMAGHIIPDCIINKLHVRWKIFGQTCTPKDTLFHYKRWLHVGLAFLGFWRSAASDVIAKSFRGLALFVIFVIFYLTVDQIGYQITKLKSCKEKIRTKSGAASIYHKHKIYLKIHNLTTE